MDRFTAVARLSDHAVLHGLESLVRKQNVLTAEILVHLNEVEVRGLYRGLGYSSMFAYCVERLGFSEDMTWKRLQVAHACRRFPALLSAIQAGKLHLTGANLLCARLTEENVGELLEEAVGQSRREIEKRLAVRFPKSDVPEVLRAIPGSARPAPAQVEHAVSRTESPGPAPAQVSRETVPRAALPSAVPPAPAKLAPLSAERYALQATLPKATHDKIRRAQELIGHRSHLVAVLDRALDLLVRQLEKQKFAATDKPRKGRRSRRARHIPADVKRQVWERDRGQCSFVSDSGHRCSERHGLEFDHIEPIARGGTSVAENLRLRCRAHNQYEAERLFGAGYMHEKRQRARRPLAQSEASSLVT